MRIAMTSRRLLPTTAIRLVISARDSARACADRHMVGKDIQKVEFGWSLGRPHCEPLGTGLWDVRSTLESNRIARVLFCTGHGYMILLHGFIKKTQKTPKADIDLALKRMKEVT